MTDTATTDVAAENTAEQIEQEQRDAEAGFAAGYKKVAGEPAEVDKAEIEAPEKSDAEREAESIAAQAAADKAKTDADSAAAAENDKAAYDALPKALRDQMATLAALPGTVNKLAGHIGGLANATQRIETALKAGKTATTAAGTRAPSETQVAAALSNPAAWKKLEEDFPDWAIPVKAEFAAIRAELARQGKPPAGVDVDALRRDFAGTVDQATEAAEERAFIRLKHPDWKQTVNTADFRVWTLQGGPSVERYTQYKELDKTNPAGAADVVNGFAREYPQWWADRGAALFGPTADDAIKLLDGFADHRKTAGDAEAGRLRREKRLTNAVTPRGSAVPPTTGISDEEAFAKGFKRARAK